MPKQELRKEFKEAVQSCIIGGATAAALVGLPAGLILDENTISNQAPDENNELLALQEYRRTLARISQYKNDDSEVAKLGREFHIKAVTDRRISEASVKHLFEDFNKNIGDFETVTGITPPDFSDIDYCREEIGTAPVDHIEALKINNCTFEINPQEKAATAMTASATAAFSAMLILGGISFASYKTKERKQRKKLPKYSKHNH